MKVGKYVEFQARSRNSRAKTHTRHCGYVAEMPRTEYGKVKVRLTPSSAISLERRFYFIDTSEILN